MIDSYRICLVSAGFCEVYYLCISEGSNSNFPLCAFWASSIKPFNPDSLPHYTCLLTFRRGEACITFSEAEWLTFLSTVHSVWVILKAGFTGEQHPRLFLMLFLSKMTVSEKVLYWTVSGFRPYEKTAAWACFSIHTIAITVLFCLHNSPVTVLTCQGSILAAACMDLIKRPGSKSVSFSAVLLLCWGSDNLLLSRSRHTVALFLSLRKPQKSIILLPIRLTVDCVI